MLEFLQKKKVWVFDGAMGTMLQKFGLELGQCPDELNLTKPEIVKKVHSDYLNAGSDIIQTNTFGANSIRLKMYGLEGKTYEINKRAVELARDVVSENNLVALSVGPIGNLIEPLGDVTREEAFEAFREQAKGADEADFINIETVQSLDEAEIAFNAFRSVLSLPISISITYQKRPNGYFTMMGESIKDTIDRSSSWNLQMIGSNCGEGFLQLVEILTEMKGLTNLALLAKPNAGLPLIKDGIQVYSEAPHYIIEKVETLFGIGVRLVGGCCGTTPAHIKEIRKIADRINSI